MFRSKGKPWGRRRCGLAGSVVLGLLLAGGCGEAERDPRDYFIERQEERRDEQKSLWRQHETPRDGDLIEMVRESDAPDGGGSMATWIDRHLAGLNGQILFPRWDVTRKGATTYDVAYHFTLIDKENDIHDRGITWQVDSLNRSVQPPEPFISRRVEDLSRIESRQTLERIRREEDSLK